MKKIVTINHNIPALNTPSVFRRSFAEKFPGALWIPLLYELLTRQGYMVTTGPEALKRIEQGTWKAQDILVVQELNARTGKELIRKGAAPFVLTCLESPLIAINFYDHLRSIARPFRHRYLFLDRRTQHAAQEHALSFPTYTTEDILPPIPWKTRKEMVLVASNKYFQRPWPRPSMSTLRSSVRELLIKLYTVFSPIARKARARQLHLARLKAVHYFSEQGLLDIYGKGWDDLRNLPALWQERFRKTGIRLRARSLAAGHRNKVRTLSRYKFTLCFENVAWPGYVTEKLIDCLVAGSIPVYSGAPDIGIVVPKNCFIDLNDFSTLQALHEHLKKMTSADARQIISNGRTFLRSKRGQAFRHDHFAREIATLICKEHP